VNPSARTASARACNVRSLSRVPCWRPPARLGERAPKALAASTPTPADPPAAGAVAQSHRSLRRSANHVRARVRAWRARGIRRSCGFPCTDRKGILTRSLRFAFTITGSFIVDSLRAEENAGIWKQEREKSNGQNSKTQDDKVGAETCDAQARDSQESSTRPNAPRRGGQAPRRPQGAAQGVVAGQSHWRRFAAGGSQWVRPAKTSAQALRREERFRPPTCFRQDILQNP